MAKITYVGSKEPGEPARVQWGAYSFELNKAVEVTDPHIIAKAANNPHFKVSGNGTAGKVAKEHDPEDDLTDAEKESAANAEEYPEDDEADEADEAEQPVKRGPGRPRKTE